LGFWVRSNRNRIERRKAYKIRPQQQEKWRNNLPAGRLKTPAPTILLMRLNTSLGIEAVPPLIVFDLSVSPPPLGKSVTELAD